MNRTILILTMALALTAPAAASWVAHGEQEPDTNFDVLSGRMFTEPDTNPNTEVRQVYFNAYQNFYLTGVNPNVGTTGSRVLTPLLLHFQAIVGVWKDCNDDGYVGLAETAAISYRAEALFSDSICKADPGNPMAHNDGEWVHEFMHVAPWLDPVNNTRDPNIIPNNDTRVWGDLGVPGFARGTSCPLAPPPQGTTSSTGAAIRWADCLANFQITGAVDELAPLDGTAGQKFTFEDNQNPQKSSSVLNQDAPESIFGNPYYGSDNSGKETGTMQKDLYEGHEDEYAFEVFDCSGERSADVHDDGVTVAGQSTQKSDGQRNANAVSEDHVEAGTGQAILRDPTVDKNGKGELEPVFGTDDVIYANWTSSDGSYFWAAALAPAVNDPAWSVAAALNTTTDSVFIGATQIYYGDPDNSGDCNVENGNAYSGPHNTAFFYADGDHEGTAQLAGKNQADMIFRWVDGVQASKQLRDTFGEGTPRNLGVDTGNYLLRANYRADVIWVTDPQVVSSDNLQPSGRAYWTFYARLTDPVTGGDNLTTYGLDLPTQSAAVYGAENCNIGIGPGAVIQNGWECDPAKWYVDPSGKDTDVNKELPRVGDPYHLRDVDCHDGELVRGSGVRASLIGVDTQGLTPYRTPCAGPDAPLES